MLVSHTATPAFDEDTLTHYTGLAPVLRLAERSGLRTLLDEHLSVQCPNSTLKAATVLAGLLTGATSIDGMNTLRAGATGTLLTHPYAPSSIGTFLRSFTHGHALQLAAINRRLLTSLTRDNPGLLGHQGPVLLDLDDSIHEQYGYHKDGVGYGYNKTKGINVITAAVSTDTTPPVITDSGLRRGPTKSGDNADWYAGRSLTTLRRMVGEDREVLARADSAFCTHDLISTLADAGVWYSVTIPHWKTVTTAISQIPESTWTPIEYTNAVYDEEDNRWVCDAEVAEIDFTAFVSRKKAEQVTTRLVVRRVKRLNPKNHVRLDQEALFPDLSDYRHHAFITNSPLDTVTADARHRQHAIVEQVFAELKNGPLTHLPSGDFAANEAWVQFATIAFNIARATAAVAGMRHARWRTVLDRIVVVASRVITHARQLRPHLLADWPWQTEWLRVWHVSLSPPGAVTV